MKFLRVFRLPSHSRFNYIPRYYDPDKEALEARLKEVEKQKENSTDAMKSRIAAGLRRGRGDSSYRRKNVVKSNITLMVTIVVLTILSLLFVYFGLPGLMETI